MTPNVRCILRGNPKGFREQLSNFFAICVVRLWNVNLTDIIMKKRYSRKKFDKHRALELKKENKESCEGCKYAPKHLLKTVCAECDDWENYEAT